MADLGASNTAQPHFPSLSLAILDIIYSIGKTLQVNIIKNVPLSFSTSSGFTPVLDRSQTDALWVNPQQDLVSCHSWFKLSSLSRSLTDNPTGWVQSPASFRLELLQDLHSMTCLQAGMWGFKELRHSLFEKCWTIPVLW